MSYSLNEIEGLARKAARGAGLEWGLAEEAGKAVRWLCASSLPGAECLAGQLQAIDNKSYNSIRPQAVNAVQWQASGGVLCPLATGPAISDRAAGLAKGVALGAISHPLLLFPYMAGAADAEGTALSLVWNDVRITRCNGVTFIAATDETMLSAAQVEQAQITPATDETGRRVRRAYRGEISGEVAAVLNGFAARTYAPETEERRLAGAGAGLTDND